MPKKKSDSKKLIGHLYRQVKYLSAQTKALKKNGSLVKAAKYAKGTYSGASDADSRNVVYTISFGSEGQGFAVLDNSVKIGEQGWVQPALPKYVYDFCVHGVGFVDQPNVPNAIKTQVDPSQFQFNWALIYLPAGYDFDTILETFNPPLETVSAEAAPIYSLLETGPIGNPTYISSGRTEAEVMTDRQPTAKRSFFDEAEDAQSTAKRLKPLPNTIAEEDEIMDANVTVNELIFPRANTLASGLGVCTYNAQTVVNSKIKAYSPRGIKTHMDDRIVFIAKAAAKQIVTISAQITFKVKF